MNTGLPDEPGVQAVAVDPTAPDTIYAGMWALNLGVYKSTDGAATWHLIETGSLALTIVIDSSHPNTVYVGTEHSGLAKSSDGGGTWQLVNSGIPERDTGEVIVDPSGGGTVYAAGCSVAKSTDGGRIWEEWIDNGIEGCVVALALDTSSRSVLYAGSEDGVLRSANGGRRWIRTNLLTSPILDVAVDQLAPGTVYAGTSGAGIYKSTNFGRTWAQVNSGLTNLVVEVLATDPSSAGTVYAGTFGGGVFKTTDGGTLWAGMNNGMTKPYVKALAIDPSAPLNVLLASHNAGCHGTSLFKSTDGGASWTTTFTLGCGLGAIGFDALAVDPSEPATVYAGHRDEGVYRSTDGGQSWVEFRQGLATTHVNSLASDGSVIYAGSMPTGVYKLVTG
jgi:photosystem II stability/assembly factor-like uncharacterized protein